MTKQPDEHVQTEYCVFYGETPDYGAVTYCQTIEEARGYQKLTNAARIAKRTIHFKPWMIVD